MSDFSHLTIGDKKVLRIGMGTNRIRDDEQSKQALKYAVSVGINFIDTASAYTGGVSEKVIGETLSPYDNIVVATKGGMVAPDFHVDASPESLLQQLQESLRKLKTQTIALYILHRVDPRTPLKESLLFLKQMQKEGTIQHIGLSQVTTPQIEEARKYVPIVTVENEYNVSERKYDNVVDYCEKENIIFIPFYPLQYQINNDSTWQTLQRKYNATEAQLALAWLLKRSPIMLPIPGSLSEKHISENAEAVKIKLSDEDFDSLSKSVVKTAE